MGFYSCFCSSWKKKKYKGEISSFTNEDNGKSVRTLHVKLEHLQKSSETTELRSSSFSIRLPFQVPGSPRCNVKITNQDSPIAANPGEVNYEGGDEQEDTLQMRRDGSDFDWQNIHVEKSENKNDGMHINDSLDMDVSDMNDKMENDNIEEGLEMLESGHVSDPGAGKAESWASPKLKRSCSDLVMRNTCQELLEQLHIGKSKSYEDMLRLTERYREGVLEGDATSPVSVMTRRSADKVILKKHSSSQILPSRSRRLWWKLFMWSHRNLYRAGIAKAHQSVRDPAINHQGGYSSDTVEPTRGLESSKIGFPSSLSHEVTNEGVCSINDQRWDEFYGMSGMWPQNQWVAFPTESSPFARVDEWVKEISAQPTFQIENYDSSNDCFVFPPLPANGISPASQSTRHPSISIPTEISHANSVVQSLNASSSVAHMTCIHLTVIPVISHFSSLRSVNLSGNLIAHITPGSLPKGLHVLNLSKNKISTIEGLKDLTRLRVIDLSYNRISRIGQGLSSCTLVKVLYLSGNKISTVEGLHRFLKLSLLDLSFNKITTTKAIGQLVANYNSLIALNLLGNPIRSNISDDQLRKTVCSLLPKLALLNKQPINMQRAREISTDAITKAALGNRNHGKLRKVASSCRSSVTPAQTSRPRSKGHSHSRPALKVKA